MILMDDNKKKRKENQRGKKEAEKRRREKVGLTWLCIPAAPLMTWMGYWGFT